MSDPRRDALATLDEAIASTTAIRDRLNESIGKMAETRYELWAAVMRDEAKAETSRGYDDETRNLRGLAS